MSQPVRLQSLVPTPGASFEQPFGMLEACHERVHRMLALLERLRIHVRGHGADTQAQQAARDVMRYFDLAAPLHHEDEELHVFPRLLAHGEPAVVTVVRRLQEDHAEMAARWLPARAVLARIAEAGTHCLQPQDEAALDAFASLYGDHIRTEEEIAYPGARALMDAREVEAAGREMARRRGEKGPPSSG